MTENIDDRDKNRDGVIKQYIDIVLKRIVIVNIQKNSLKTKNMQ